MKSIVSDYLEGISQKYSRETSTEYSYRTEFESFIKQVFESMNINAIDHDAKSKDRNKPDFVIIKNNIPILYIETKDIGISLDKVEKSEQMSRYFGYANLVLTDYLEFRFYRNGVKYGEPIVTAEFDKKERTIKQNEDKFENLITTLLDFTKSYKEPIKSGEHLAKIMGGKAQRIRDNIREYLKNESSKTNETLRVFETIKKLLVHDLNLESFSDMYAQTIVYGLFVARFYDDTPDNFTRQEARDLIPNSNPFLRQFFDHIVGPNFDKRLEYIVNELCEVFSHSDVEKLMSDFYKKSSKSNTTNDPVIHFYEDFLKEYDPDLRKKMGAYYTPTPVVRFITKSVDYLLKKEFKLKNGLADTTKLKNEKTHKVQILDPAVGTGTFISGVIREIYKNFKGQEGRWPTYVHNDLLPRIHGFELMMAPYTIAHLKLGMAFKETGFKYFIRRLGIYLTNSLEKGDENEGLFPTFGLVDSIAQESKQASKIKNETPVMIVIGNPPYSVSSSNKGKWITDLTKDYKENLNERNIQPLSDDYIKFIRLAEYFVERNSNGIVAMITNNSFIDGIIHRQMRKHLLETFDEIYILDLHGNLKKEEVAKDGKKDENVFNIQQGVSICILIKKTTKNKKLGEVYYSELYGKRSEKFEKLNKNNIESIEWKKIKYSDPYYFFVYKNFGLEAEYNNSFNLEKFFNEKTCGCVTSDDKTFLAKTEEDLEKQITKKFKDLIYERKFVSNYLYRPFEICKIYYDPTLLGRAREKVFKHFKKDNIGLIISKQFGSYKHFIVFVSKQINDKSSQPFAPYYNHPLYLYSEDGTKISNLNKEIVNKIEKIVGNTSPEDILDYIYAILHSPNYRQKYEEFLKINFPMVPYPKNTGEFKKLVRLGQELRLLHLLESKNIDDFITTYPEIGSDVIEINPILKNSNVYINNNQYFGNISNSVWNFYIAGYQPAQKWLKDRKGQKLNDDDIKHYQKIIVALTETEKIMKEIDKIIDL